MQNFDLSFLNPKPYQTLKRGFCMTVHKLATPESFTEGSLKGLHIWGPHIGSPCELQSTLHVQLVHIVFFGNILKTKIDYRASLLSILNCPLRFEALCSIDRNSYGISRNNPICDPWQPRNPRSKSLGAPWGP